MGKQFEDLVTKNKVAKNQEVDRLEMATAFEEEVENMSPLKPRLLQEDPRLRVVVTKKTKKAKPRP